MTEEYTIGELEKKIGYQFRDKSLLKQALTHSSFANEQRINKLKDYERLEFLGDAVLELISSDFLSMRIRRCRKESLRSCVPRWSVSRRLRTAHGISSWDAICCLERARRRPVDATAIRLPRM